MYEKTQQMEMALQYSSRYNPGPNGTGSCSKHSSGLTVRTCVWYRVSVVIQRMYDRTEEQVLVLGQGARDMYLLDQERMNLM